MSVDGHLRVPAAIGSLFASSSERPTTVLSFGGGQDSWTLLLLALFDRAFRERYIGSANFLAVFSDTGNEYPETYRALDQARRLCETWRVPFFHLRGRDGYHSPGWSAGIEGQMAAHDTLILRSTRSCTDGTKVAPIYMFLDEHLGTFYGWPHGNKRALRSYAARFGKLRVMIGYAKGEERRAARASASEAQLALPLGRGAEPKERNAWMRDCVERVYPLIDLGMDRTACQRYCEARGLTIWPSNCMMCPHSTEDDVLTLSIERPEIFERWCGYEAAKLARFAAVQHNHGVKGERTLREVAAAQRALYADRSDEALLAFLRERRYSRGHCVTSSH